MRKAESLDPLSLIIKSDLAELLLIAHFYDASIQQSRRTIDMDVTFRWHTTSWARRTCTTGYSNAPEIAVIDTALGDRDQAMTWLEQGYEERFNPGVLLRPGFDPLRSDLRFQALVRRVGLNK
jgi:hypothetical protein